ncbi:MAG: tryptophan--tRNA ligase [bacterium]|nr:tryptophan--tRNA ligase [bacterium]
MKVFSGIQPSGVPHIGNYIGAIHNWLSLQKGNQCIFSIVDMHTITVPHTPKELHENIGKLAAWYLAFGLNPEKSILFVQSDVKEHAELAWILNTLTKISELKLMHQFKEKSKDRPDSITAALFDYPVLMAADILLYGTTLVPIGEDQQQHLELTRELARRFNGLYGDTFSIPEGYVSDIGARIMGLDDPKKKMSKSAQSSYNYISFDDSPEIIRRKISRAVTDSDALIKAGVSKPAVSNLLAIYSAVTGKPIGEIEKFYHGKGYKEFKGGLAEELVAFIRPLQEKYEEYISKPKLLARLLADGAEKARAMASGMMKEVREKVGLGRI